MSTKVTIHPEDKIVSLFNLGEKSGFLLAQDWRGHNRGKPGLRLALNTEGVLILWLDSLTTHYYNSEEELDTPVILMDVHVHMNRSES